MQGIAVIAALAVSLGAWSARAAPASTKSVEAAAHGAYVAAINSNDTETLASTFSDGVPTGNGAWPSTDGAPIFQQRNNSALPVLRRPLLAAAGGLVMSF